MTYIILKVKITSKGQSLSNTLFWRSKLHPKVNLYHIILKVRISSEGQSLSLILFWRSKFITYIFLKVRITSKGQSLSLTLFWRSKFITYIILKVRITSTIQEDPRTLVVSILGSKVKSSEASLWSNMRRSAFRQNYIRIIIDYHQEYRYINCIYQTSMLSCTF